MASSPFTSIPGSGAGQNSVSYQSVSGLDDSKKKKPNFYYEEIISMFNSELYSSVLAFSSWSLTLSQQFPDVLNEFQQCHVYIMCGDAAYRIQEFHRAETYYVKSLTIYKPLVKNSPHLKTRIQEDCGTSNDLKYKLYLCLVQCKKPNEALKMLEGIPAKQRNVQINMALGNLYKETGMERAAVTCYKEVLRTCPMALDAIEQLLLLGSNEDDVQSLVRDKTSKQMQNLDWYNSWIRATAACAARDNFTGIKIYKEIRQKHKLFGCVQLLQSLGVANTNYGDYAAAIETYKSASYLEPMNTKGMDIYAFLLWHEEMNQELHKLMTRLNDNNLNEAKSEPWIASAYYTMTTNRLNRAHGFAMRGSKFLGSKNPEGIIAQGHVFLKMKKYQEAVECFREVMACNPERFEPHRGIVECYIATSRARESICVAFGALKSVGHSPRVLNLCAIALMNEPLNIPKAKTYLEKALEIDNGFLPAIMTFVDILETEGKYNEGIQFLKNCIDLRISAQLHIRLAVLMSRCGQEENAADQYSIALRIDPTNKEAKEGLNRVEPSSARIDGSYTFGDEMDLEDEEDDEGDHADSELDTTIWEDYGLNETR